MALVKFNKVSTLPGTLDPNTFYFVENGTYTESYLTNSAGVAKSVGNSAMINALIATAIAGLASDINSVEIVADIAARNALTATLSRNAMILVINAIGDATVASGSAMYAWDDTGSTIYKVAEYESMDAVIQWSAIQGKPASSAAAIDSAVSASHSHGNKAVLDNFSIDGEGLLYGGVPIASRWTTNNW